MGIFYEYNYEYETKAIDPDLLKFIKKKIAEGKELLISANPDTISGAHFAWVHTFAPIIDIIDPKGEEYSGSLATKWHIAHLYNQDSAKNPYEDSIIFGQCVAVAESLLDGQVKVVKDKKINKKNPIEELRNTIKDSGLKTEEKVDALDTVDIIEEELKKERPSLSRTNKFFRLLPTIENIDALTDKIKNLFK